MTSQTESIGREAARIQAEYQRRAMVVGDRYALSQPDALFQHQHVVRALRRALHRERLFPLAAHRILEVGCGRADWLLVFELLGASSDRLAGIDLDAERLADARRRLASGDAAPATGGAELRCGNAAALPWPDASFDVVFQATMFTSILDTDVKAQVAREMMRVLKPGGAIVWYDFTYDNPRNPHVMGIPVPEIRALFPGYTARFERVTLAPPIARRLVRWSWLAAELVAATRFFNTHVLGTLRPGALADRTSP